MTNPNQEPPNRDAVADRSNSLSDARRRQELESKGTPIDAEETAATQFPQQVASKGAGLNDLESEESEWMGGFRPKAMIRWWVLIVIAGVALLIAAPMLDSRTIPMALGLEILIWIVGGYLNVWRRLGFYDPSTTQTFIHRTGIMTRQTDPIEVIDKVQEVAGLIDDILCLGRRKRSLHIESI